MEALLIHPIVAIIILNWNGWLDTVECLESLYQITYPNYTVILVDNGSEDETIDKIKAYCDGKTEVKSKFFEYDPNNKPIKIIEFSKDEAEAGGGREREISSLLSNRKIILIKNEKNYGFAEGNNIGIWYACNALNPDYILLLNNDTVVDKYFLDNLVNDAVENPSSGFFGPKIYYYDFNGRSNFINHAGGKVIMWRGVTYHVGDKVLEHGQYDESAIVDYVTGACLLVKREVIHKIGLLNPRYFAYWEDVDWCERGGRAGYSGRYVSSAKIWHKLGASSRGVMTIYYSTRNRIWFIRDNAGVWDKIKFFTFFFCYDFWYLIGVHLIYHANSRRLIIFLLGVKDGIFSRSV